MNLINPKFSTTKENSPQDSDLHLSPLVHFGGSEFKSIFTPTIEMQRNLLRSQISHDPNSSPFVPHFSELKNSHFTPTDRKGNCELDISPLNFESIIEKKVNDLQHMQFFKPETPATESGRERTTTQEISSATKQIQQSDIIYLRNIINPNIETNTKKLFTKRPNKVKPRIKSNLQSVRRRTRPFMCKYCTMSFNKSQALGGHMSRTHPGESHEYKKKKIIRKNRELERVKLLIAKRKFFKSLNYNYDDMLKTPEGKMNIRVLINRTSIKKLKKTLTKEELDNFIEKELIDNISN